MNVITDVVAEKSLDFIVELLAHSAKAMVPIGRHFHGVSFHRALVYEAVHARPPFHMEHSWKNSHIMQPIPGDGM